MSPWRSHMRSIEIFQGKRVLKDAGGTDSHKIGNSSSTDHDHPVQFCTGCRRHYSLPKPPHGGILVDFKTPLCTTIPGMVLTRRQCNFVDEMVANSDDKTLVVSYITPTREKKKHSELLELFNPFGEVSSAVFDNALHGNFGFVTFVNKEDAEKAMNTLNDGYLKVDWASNRKKST